MNDVLKREINHAYMPKDVQAAIDTILSYSYALLIENKVLQRRIKEAKRLLDDGEVCKEIAATYTENEAAEAARIRKIVNEMPAQEGGAK